MSATARPVRRVAPDALVCPPALAAMQHALIESGVPHEPEFNLLRRLPRRGLLVLDAGANIGNSAISCALVRPGVRIVAFEPNPALAPLLDQARAFCGPGMVWRPFGLAATSGQRLLHVPVVDGVPILGEAALDPAHFDDPVVTARLRGYGGGADFTLDACALPFRALDDLPGLRAICRGAALVLFKLDVEGAEPDVLDGATATIAECQPLLLIEQGERPEISARLAPLGYARYLHGPGNRLRPAGEARALNSIFALPAQVAAFGLDRPPRQ